MVTYHTYYDETYIIDLSLLFLSPGSGLLLTLQVILGLLELSLQLSLLLLCLGPAGCFFLRSEREGGGEGGRRGGRAREGERERERERGRERAVGGEGEGECTRCSTTHGSCTLYIAKCRFTPLL